MPTDNRKNNPRRIQYLAHLANGTFCALKESLLDRSKANCPSRNWVIELVLFVNIFTVAIYNLEPLPGLFTTQGSTSPGKDFKVVSTLITVGVMQ